MSAPEIPLGQLESERLEFKDRAALDEPRKIAREVVAFLNADGGEVWIGLGEEAERAVRLQPIPRIGTASASIRDTMADVIEPAPANDEVAIETVPVEGGEILRIAVERGRRRPYALLHRGRHFVIRFGNRVRPMTREEIAAAFRFQEPEELVEAVVPAAFADRLAELQSKAAPVLWIRAQPRRHLDLDLASEEIESLFREPSKSGNRRDWFTVLEPFTRPQPTREGHCLQDKHGKSTLVSRSGPIDFTLPLARLEGGVPMELDPPRLLQYMISLFRLASKLWQSQLGESETVFAATALISVRGRTLRAYGPRYQFSPAVPRTWSQSEDLVFERPLQFKFREVATEPDRCGARLVERIYDSFGLDRGDWIPAFNWETGRLEFPD